MQEIKFSVLMSIYKGNKVSEIKESIDSLLNQTLMPNQIVIMIDGPVSQDIHKLLDNYANEYTNLIELHYRDKNIGLGLTLNEGLNYCNYEYVARMDADDISVKNRFEKQIQILKKHPEYDALGGNIVEFDDVSLKELSLRMVPTGNEEILKFLKRRNPMNHVTVILKKKSVIESGNYLECPYFEDYYLWARMLNKNKKLVNMNEILVKVRAGINMSNRRGNFNYIKCIINFENKLRELGFINYVEYCFNISVRSIVACIPNKLRYYLYQEKLRNGTKK